MVIEFYKGLIILLKFYLSLIFLIWVLIYFFTTGYNLGLFINFIQLLFLICINDIAVRRRSLLMLIGSFICFFTLLYGLISYIIDCRKLSPFPAETMIKYGKCN